MLHLSQMSLSFGPPIHGMPPPSGLITNGIKWYPSQFFPLKFVDAAAVWSHDQRHQKEHEAFYITTQKSLLANIGVPFFRTAYSWNAAAVWSHDQRHQKEHEAFYITTQKSLTARGFSFKIT